MSAPTLLVANRGEIAVRILSTAQDLGYRTIAISSEDDSASLHTRRADHCHMLEGRGVAAYLDGTQILEAAATHGATLIHPGYGFLSENAGFAAQCAEAGVAFIGPRPDTLSQFGDKAAAKALASSLGIPVLEGEAGIDGAQRIIDAYGAVVLKAVAGGGGRGMRVVRSSDALQDAWQRASSEALAAFGSGELICERFLTEPRHIEMQIIGDGNEVLHLGVRECSLQRRHQKIIEFAPAFQLSDHVRDALCADAVRLGQAVGYRSLGTVEFLVSGDDYFFIETNPRLQVEHTVTETVTGHDLVALQLALEQGRTLADLALRPQPHGYAVQLRVNMEQLQADGSVVPGGGTLTAFDPPMGRNVRVDTFAYAGLTTSPSFDSLLAKVIVQADSYAQLLDRAYRALCDFRISGVTTNIDLLKNVLRRSELEDGAMHVQFIDQHAAALIGPTDDARHFESGAEASTPIRAEESAPQGHELVRAPMQGTIIELSVEPGQAISAGTQLLVMDAMKMEHVIEAPVSGIVREVRVAADEAVYETHGLVLIEVQEIAGDDAHETAAVDLDHIRDDLAEVISRHEIGLDAARPAAVARRRKTGHITARECLDLLVDPDTFVEYGPLTIAAQRRRRSVEDLIENTPADGMIAGIGHVNGAQFDEAQAQCAVLSYDYTVLAGTQGSQNHRKKDRLFDIAEQHSLPVIFFTEGGGGRPGDTDGLGVAGLDCWAFNYFGKLSGLVPLVGITSGRCFAGNAALLGCCDVVIATEGSNIGMGGPAMIEGGGLGVFAPEEVGPMDVQVPNGVVDIPVKDYPEAIEVAKKYLSYFQGGTTAWQVEDQRRLRHSIPENRLRVYDIREVINTLADADSVLEIRPHFGLSMITAFARFEGRPVGIIANNPAHLSGAIDSPAADKATRFMQLCDAFDIPIVFLCDCPGIMVGPEVEKTALVRHAARMFVTGASISVPFCTIVLRKCYGLGAQAMAGGSYKAPYFAISWPTGEFGGMGLEGAVKLGYRKELEAETDPQKREALYNEMVDRMYRHGKAVSTASHFEIDEVIDPQDSRRWIMTALRGHPLPKRRKEKKRPCVDTW